MTVNDVLPEHIAVLSAYCHASFSDRSSCLLWNLVVCVRQCGIKSNSHLFVDAARGTDLQLDRNKWWPGVTLKKLRLAVTMSLPPPPAGSGDAGLESASHPWGTPAGSPLPSRWQRVSRAGSEEAAAASPPAVWESGEEEPPAAEETKGEDVGGQRRRSTGLMGVGVNVLKSSSWFSFTPEKFRWSL